MPNSNFEKTHIRWTLYSKQKSASNKVVKPHNGPSAVLVLNATGHNVVQDANGFSAFWLNGFPTGFLVDWWKR